MFEKAVRMKLRFHFKGMCTVEDLWDLSVEDLDGIYTNLHKLRKDNEEVSLLNKTTEIDETLSLQMNILKHIVEVKLKEREARKNMAVKAEKKRKLLAIIAEKQDEAYKGMTVENLNKLVEGL